MPIHIIQINTARKFDNPVEFVENIAAPTARNAPTTAVLNINGLGTIKLTQAEIKTISNISIYLLLFIGFINDISI